MYIQQRVPGFWSIALARWPWNTPPSGLMIRGCTTLYINILVLIGDDHGIHELGVPKCTNSWSDFPRNGVIYPFWVDIPRNPMMLRQGSRSHWFHQGEFFFFNDNFAKKPPLSSGILPLKHGKLMAWTFPLRFPWMTPKCQAILPKQARRPRGAVVFIWGFWVW